MAAAAPLLAIRELRTRFSTPRGELYAVDRLSLDVEAGASVGVVGESGSGKSVTALSVMRLLRDPPGRIVAGSIRLDGRELLTLSERQMQKVRGAEVGMIFQEPMTSLNPVMSAGKQVAEALVLHRGLGQRAALAEAAGWFERVGIPDPARRVHDFPHQLSGGMRQRVMIAMALSCRPRLIIADEPTTALDVTIQAQILELLSTLRRELGTAVLLITHDLGVVAESCDHVVVMYAGQVVESAPAAVLFGAPRHPYTAGLVASRRPRVGQGRHLQEIPGLVPELSRLPPGCRFAERCPRRLPACEAEPPPLGAISPGHLLRCIAPLPPPAAVTEEARP